VSLAGKRVLVTGATGFLGGALARRLANEGAHVRALARRPERGAFLRDRAELIAGDVTDADQMRNAVEGCSHVFHVAVSYGDFAAQQWVNVEGTRQVIQAANAARIERFVHVSSIAVYGYRQTGDVSEATQPTPSADPYVITKAEAEKVVCSESDLPYSIIRPGMIYGPRSGMWTRTLFRLARRRPTTWIGDGGGSAHPIYVDDVVDMMIVLATHPAVSREIFNCVPDPAPTWREFLGAYSRLAGHESWLGIPPSALRVVSNVASAFARPQTQMKALPELLDSALQRVTFKMTKAKTQLGWQPQVSLQVGIKNCAAWLREEGLLV
jgi:2-alkyl-3-oxoalkanoate reductase